MVFSADEQERKSLAKSLIDVAMRSRGRVMFTTVDAEKHAFFLEYFGLKRDELPAFAIQTLDDVFKMKQDIRITPDAIDDFIGQTLGSVII
jgi:protein disulfide-isomerase A1